MNRSKFLKLLGIIAVAPVAIAKALETEQVIEVSNFPPADVPEFKKVSWHINEEKYHAYYKKWELLDSEKHKQYEWVKFRDWLQEQPIKTHDFGSGNKIIKLNNKP